MDISSSTLKISFAKVCSLLFSFLGVAYFAQNLGAASLGVLFLFQAVLGVLALPANLGTSIAVEKRLSEGDPPDQVLGAGLALKTTLLLPIVVAITLLRGQVNQYLGAELAGFLAVAIVLQELAKFMMSALRGELRVGETAILSFAYVTIWISLGAVLITLGHGVVGLVLSLIVARGVQFLWAVSKTDACFSSPNVEQIRSLIEYAKFSIVPEIDAQVHSWIDVIIIGIFLTPAAVGAYEVAWRVAAPVLLVTGAIGTTIFPKISSWKTDESIEPLERLLPKIITPSLAIVFPAFFGGILLSQEILTTVFGPEFGIASLALVVLLAGKLPRAIQQIAGKSLLGLNQPELVTRAALVDIIANIILNIILVWHFGIVGAALGTTLSMSLGTVHRVHYLSRYVDVQVPYQELTWCFLSSIGMFLILFAANGVVSVSNVYELGVFVSSGALIYFVLLWFYSPLRNRILRQIHSLTHGFPIIDR